MNCLLVALSVFLCVSTSATAGGKKRINAGTDIIPFHQEFTVDDTAVTVATTAEATGFCTRTSQHLILEDNGSGASQAKRCYGVPGIRLRIQSFPVTLSAIPSVNSTCKLSLAKNGTVVAWSEIKIRLNANTGCAAIIDSDGDDILEVVGDSCTTRSPTNGFNIDAGDYLTVVLEKGVGADCTEILDVQIFTDGEMRLL